MPVLDGIDSAARMRELMQSGQRPQTPIVALSASCAPAEKERCRLAGISYHFAKPMKLEMMSALSRIIEEAQEANAAVGGAGATRRRSSQQGGRQAAATDTSGPRELSSGRLVARASQVDADETAGSQDRSTRAEALLSMEAPPQPTAAAGSISVV